MEKRLRWHWKSSMGYSWRVDETYIKVKGEGTYLCEYLKVLGENEREFQSSVKGTLQWERDLSLLALPEEWQLLQQVYISNTAVLE
jgi:hypothetical protein